MILELSFLFIAFIIGKNIRKNYKKLGFVGSYAGVASGMFVYYALTPFLLFLFKEGFYANSNTYGFTNVTQKIIEGDSISYIEAIILIIIGFFVFNFSYKVRTSFRKRTHRNEGIGQIYKENNTYYRLTAQILFLICVPSMIIYIIGLGGLSRALTLAETLRGFDVSISAYANPIFGFFHILSAFISVCSLLWLYIYKVNRSFLHLLIFIVTFALTIIFCLTDAGRTKLLLYLFSILYITFRERIKNIWFWVFLLIIPALYFIDVLSGVFEFFQSGNIEKMYIKDTTLLNCLRQFSYPIRSLLYLKDIMKSNKYLFFKNILLDTIGLLPGLDFDKSYFMVAEYFVGYNWMARGGVPCDLLTYGYINMSVFGVLLLSWLLGKICYKCDKYYMEHLSCDSRHFWGIVLAGAFFNLVANADWSAILYNNCSLTVPIILIFFDARYHKKNQNLTQSNYISGAEYVCQSK